MAIEFVPITRDKQYAMATVEREAYQLHSGLYDEYKELKQLLGHQAARRYSFLLKDGDYQAYCIASMQNSVVQLEQPVSALYIADFAVRSTMQGAYYGLSMASELLHRADEDNVQHIEFHARGSTSYSAITSSRHTESFLNKHNYRLGEVSVSDIYAPDGQWQESLHLISLEKMTPNPL